MNSLFTLQSSFSPQGDQEQAIKLLMSGLNQKKTGQVLLGATGTGKTFTMANIIANTGRPALIMCHNKTLAAQLASEFQEFFPNNAVCYFVSYYDYYQPEAYIARTDTYIEKETAINEEIEKYRHYATHSLMTRKDVIIIASVSAIYGLGDVSVYKELAIPLKVGENYIRNVFLRQLVDLQYKRSSLEFKRGMFSVFGDTIEVFPPSTDRIIRFEFFGDELESITEADPFTGETYETLSEISLFPATHNVSTKDRILDSLPLIQKEMEAQYDFFIKNNMIVNAERIKTRTEYDIEMLRETGYTTGIENYVRYLNNASAGDPPKTLMDYFPEDFLLFIDESHITIPQIRGMYNGNLARKKNLVDYGFRLPSAYDNRPLQFLEFEKYMKNTVFVSATPQKYEFEYSKNSVVEQIIRPTGLLDPEIEIRDSDTQVKNALKEIKNRISKNERVLITTTTKKLSEKMSEFLGENDISAKYLHSEIDTFDRVEILRELRLGSRNKGIDVIVGINLLREGLDLPEVSLICVFDADKEGFLRSRDALIQIVGRAARNVNGRVLFYSRKEDGVPRITRAMQECIDETNRRRAIQEAHNKKHNITPQTIVKDISYLAYTLKDPKKAKEISTVLENIPEEGREMLKKQLQAQMELASLNLEFEKAAELRDQIEIVSMSE